MIINSKLLWDALLIATAFIYVLSFMQEKKTSLTLKDIYSNRTYRENDFSSLRWMKDNNCYSTLEASTKWGAQDIVKHFAPSGERTV